MSDPRNAPVIPPPHERNGCLTALTIAIGIVLLLPGLCAIIIVGADPRAALSDSTSLTACLAFLAIAAGGVLMIRWGVRRQR